MSRANGGVSFVPVPTCSSGRSTFQDLKTFAAPKISIELGQAETPMQVKYGHADDDDDL